MVVSYRLFVIRMDRGTDEALLKRKGSVPNDGATPIRAADGHRVANIVLYIGPMRQAAKAKGLKCYIEGKDLTTFYFIHTWLTKRQTFASMTSSPFTEHEGVDDYFALNVLLYVGNI